jgi:hypothetical protein
MKTRRVAVMVAVVSFLAACGGGGGSSNNAIQAAIDSFADFTTIVDSAQIQQCWALAQTTPCDCPGGGTATGNLTAQTITLVNCKSAAGWNYNGTFTVNVGAEEVTADMTAFGECTTVNGTVSASGTCGGNISGTCDGGAVNCDVVDDTTGAGECTLSC